MQSKHIKKRTAGDVGLCARAQVWGAHLQQHRPRPWNMRLLSTTAVGGAAEVLHWAGKNKKESKFVL